MNGIQLDGYTFYHGDQIEVLCEVRILGEPEYTKDWKPGVIACIHEPDEDPDEYGIDYCHVRFRNAMGDAGDPNCSHDWLWRLDEDEYYYPARPGKALATAPLTRHLTKLTSVHRS